MPWTTREQLQTLPATGLAGVRLASPRAVVERAALTDDDKERVRRELGDDAAAGRLVRFVASTEGRATDGHVIKAAGWALDNYRANPLVLWQHSRWQQRVADSVVWVDGTVLRAVASFFPRDLSPLSYTLGELAATRGHAASVGFDIISATPSSEEVRRGIPWALDIHSAELVEWSLVNLPADAGALADARAAGLDVDAVADAVSALLDATGVDRARLERVWAAAADPARARVHVPPTPTPTTIDATAVLAAVREARAKAFGPQLPTP